MTRSFRPIAVPSNVHSAVKALFSRMNEREVNETELAEISGLSQGTVSSWISKKRSPPNVMNLEAALNVVGLTICVQERPSA